MAVSTSKLINRGLTLIIDAKNPKSYPGSGNNWKDLSGNNNNTTLVNNVNFKSEGPEMAAMDLANTGSYISIDSNIGITDWPFTVMCWVKFNTTSSHEVFAIGNSAVNDQQTGFGVKSTNGILNTYIWNYSGSIATSTGTTIATDTWYNFCAIYISDDEKYLYINGEKDITWNITQNCPTGLNKVSMGRLVGSTTGDILDGELAYTNIHTVALTEDEVRNTYNKLKPRFGNRVIEQPRIAYQRPNIGIAQTPRNDGDHYWQVVNGLLPYPADPNNPATYARPASDNSYNTSFKAFALLRNDNIFGNKYRWTNTVGRHGSTPNTNYSTPQFHYVNDWDGAIHGYVIDHLTGLAWTAYAQNPPNGVRNSGTITHGGVVYQRETYQWQSCANYSQGLNGEEQFNMGGFKDWRLPTFHEAATFFAAYGGIQFGYNWTGVSAQFGDESLNYWYNVLSQTGNPPRVGTPQMWTSDFWGTYNHVLDNYMMRGFSITSTIACIFVRNHY